MLLSCPLTWPFGGLIAGAALLYIGPWWITGFFQPSPIKEIFWVIGVIGLGIAF